MRSWRINFILIVFFILGAAIISRLFFLQIINHKLYQAQALGQQAGFSETQGRRGEVFFENSQESKGSQSNGKTTGLAINKEKWIVSAMPGEIENKENFSQILSQVIAEEKPDVVVHEIVGGLFSQVVYHLCVKHGITFLGLSSSRFPDRIDVYDSEHTCSKYEKTFEKLGQNDISAEERAFVKNGGKFIVSFPGISMT